ncbi:MAG: sialidase family protein [Methylomonas sp.]
MLRIIGLLPVPLYVFVLLMLSACADQHYTTKAGGADYSHYPQGGGLYVASAFDQQGRLWRVVPEKGHVYVDYSTDLGKTFSAPVRVNQEAERIKVSGENSPNIAVDKAGLIYIIYAAEGSQPVTVYSSVSKDSGRSFSKPVPISDKASEANSFQARLILNHQDQAYVFWHDERDRTDWRQLGNAIYSTRIDENNHGHSSVYKISDMLCECCHIAAAFDSHDQAVLLARFIYPDGARDHGLIQASNDGKDSVANRVTFDQWKIEACPEHGPSLAIANDDRIHITWFTQGNVRQGVFYAYSVDHGQHFSTPLALGASGKLASHPDVMADAQHVVLAWLEFDGAKTQLQTMQSQDGGLTWLPPRALAESASSNNYPYLLKNKGHIYVSWNSMKEGYRLFAVD